MAAAHLTTLWHNPRMRAVAAILAVLLLGWALLSLHPRHYGRLLAQNTQWSGPAWYSLPRPPSNAPAPPPPIVFALLFLGAGTAEEGSQMIKSALMHLSVPAHFHVVCTPDACAYVGQRFALMPRPAHEVQVTLHEVKYEQLVARVQRAGLSGDNYYQLAKLFLHEVLPAEVELAMFIDADMLFIRDPLALWRVFEEFHPDTIAAMPTVQENSHAGMSCSCTILMNLTLMRDPAAPLLPSSLVPHTLHSALSADPFARAAHDGIPAPRTPVDLNDRVAWDPHALAIADQSVLHVLWTYMRPRFLRLRQDWDVTNCANFYGVDPTKGAGDGDAQADAVAAQRVQDEMRDVDGLIVPGMIHLNCIDHPADKHSYSKGSNPYRLGWGSFIKHVVTFKWVWLNRGDGSARTSVYVVKVDRILDEHWAEARVAP